MRIKCSKPNISGYDFLRLYAAIMITENKNPIINNHHLEKELYILKKRPQYEFLFEDIEVLEDPSLIEHSHVDLTSVFQNAYAWNLLIMIQDNSDIVRSVINLNYNEALSIIACYGVKEVLAMQRLCSEIEDVIEETKDTTVIKGKNL